MKPKYNNIKQNRKKNLKAHKVCCIIEVCDVGSTLNQGCQNRLLSWVRVQH
ncbi:hypothetical protein KFK09_007349 [Dendrobium nobile]|uniref:Uncharacterized protein n=1 Tax=Dendrobium nobile TaxID=94219 RepID=A0A8T3BRT5_DENNO|nr:hypothetical protein KFK09_007349 [Dendrobium nobile]